MKKETFNSIFGLVVVAYLAIAGSLYYKNSISSHVPDNKPVVEQPVVEKDNPPPIVEDGEPKNPTADDREPISRAPVNINVSSWTYWLKGAKIDEIIKSPFEMVVLDQYAKGNRRFLDRDIAKLRKAGKTPLVFLSIGEAENYRNYWNSLGWGKKTPQWIGEENPLWKGVYAIKEPLNPDWLAVVYSMIDEAKLNAFSGVVLGGLDSYQFTNNDAAKQQMIELVKKASEYAKKNNFNDFIVITQDALELTTADDYLKYVDGVIKQDLVYSWKSNGTTGPKNPAKEFERSLELLKDIKKKDKAVFVVEYVSGDKWDYAKQIIQKNDFVGLSAPRQLNQLRLQQ